MFRGFFNDSFFETPSSSFSSIFEEEEDRRGMPQMIQSEEHGSDRRVDRRFNDQVMRPFGGMDPFSSFNGLISEMNNFMSRDLTSQFMVPSRMMDLENGVGYSSMKVQSYVNDGSGKPKSYEAQHSTRYAPGRVKQVQKSVRDSEAGVEKMSVGRHIGDRGHVITKSRNQRSSDIEQMQDFRGFAEEEQPKFNQEWDRVTQQFFQPHHHGMHSLPHGENKKRNKLREKCLKPNRFALDQA